MSRPFIYYTPTKVFFGKEVEKKAGMVLRDAGYHKILIHYGGNSVIKSGLLERVKEDLSKKGLEYVLLGGVVPNPRLSKVKEGIALGRKENVDFILAVGGGSVLDSAKAIGLGIVYDGEVWDFFDSQAHALGAIPVGSILTLAATGSEMSTSTVITNEKGWIKRGYHSDYNRPLFAFLNPELTMTLPSYQTASGCVDIMMHTMERYLNPHENLALTDRIAESLLINVRDNALILKEDPENYEARANIMWAASLSHNGLTSAGGDGGDWSAHMLEHELGAKYDVAHGAGLAAIWGTWARYVMNECPERFAQYAERVWGIPKEGSLEKMALAGIEATEDFFRQIEMPTSLEKLGIMPTDEEIHEMAQKASATINNRAGKVKKLSAEDIITIFKKAS